MQDAHLAETQQSLRPIRPEHQQRQRQDHQLEGGENFDYYVDRKLDGGFTESHGETRRQHLHLHLQLRSGQLRNGKRVGAHGNLYLRNGGDFGFLLRIPENRRCSVDSTPTHNTHLCSTVCSQARNAHHALGSSNHGLHFIFVRLKRICHLVLHMSHPLLFSHLPFTSSTSSSSFTLPSTTTQEQAAQSVQHDRLQEHPVHHAHLQALPVDKLRHQESLWHENLQSGGNPPTTTPTDQEEHQSCLGVILQIQTRVDLKSLPSSALASLIRHGHHSNDEPRLRHMDTLKRTRKNDSIGAAQNASLHHTNKKKIQEKDTGQK